MAPPAVANASESLAKVIWRGRWIMFICLVLALAAGFVYIQTATPIYTSTAKLYLDYSGIRIAPSYESDRVPRTDRYLYTQAELLVSQPILKAVLTLPEMQRLQTFADVSIRMAYLRNNVEVEVGRRDEIVSVSFSSPYAAEVPQIVNKIVEAYIASRSESQREDSSQVFDRYQKEYDRATQELDQMRDELEQFQAASMLLTLGSDQGNGVDARYRELETEFAQAQLQTVDAELFFNAVRLLADDPEALRQYVALAGHVAAYAGGGNTTAQLEAEQASVESELESLLVELTPDHPKVVSLQARIEQIETTIDESKDRFVRVQLAAAEQRYLEAKAREEDLARRCEEQRQEVRQMNDELTKYRRLATEVAELTAYRQMIGEQLKEIRTIAGQEVGGFRMQILESASTSEFPSHPQRSKVMAIALVLGLLAGGGLAVLRDLTDQTLRSGEEISSVLGLPVLGVVPAMSRRESVSARGRHVHLRPDAPEAEAFRTVRTAIFFGTSKEQARTVLVTSPAQGDGKSTLASNLAIAMAQAGQRTILLDADFRRPVQHAIFEIPADENGLSAVIAGKTKLAQAIQPTAVPGLEVISSGPRVPNPAEILNSPRFKELLEHLVEAYDRIIVDAPPVTVVTDAQILGAICDATILVLRAGKSTRKVGQRAIDSLHRVDARLLGTVVNDVAKSGDRYGYYGGYGGSNGSGRSRAKTGKTRQVQPDVQRAQPAMVSEGGE